jgi:hypothetical protein
MNDFMGRINYSQWVNVQISFICFRYPQENSLDNEDESHSRLSHQFMVYTMAMSIIEISPLENNIHLTVSPHTMKNLAI